jgi:ComF family protein
MFPVPVLVRETLLAAADLVWPRRCLHCDGQSASEICLCEACRKTFTEDSHNSCPRCCSTIGPHADASDGCLLCKSSRFHFASAQRLGVYDGQLRDAILSMKHRGGETLAEVMGLVWAEAHRKRLMKPQPQAVVAVPLHWRKRFSRGFNQAEMIARGVALGLGIPLIPRAIRRVRPTPQQTGVTPTERRENMKNAFRPSRTRRLKGLRILLIDDVLTTGATADAAAVAILAGGAAQVDVAVLAHR